MKNFSAFRCLAIIKIQLSRSPVYIAAVWQEHTEHARLGQRIYDQ